VKLRCARGNRVGKTARTGPDHGSETGVKPYSASIFPEDNTDMDTRCHGRLTLRFSIGMPIGVLEPVHNLPQH
jgi:hypothetical protein